MCNRDTQRYGIQYWYAESHYAVCHLCRASFMLSVANELIMLSVVMLSVVMLSVVMLSVAMQNVVAQL